MPQSDRRRMLPLASAAPNGCVEAERALLKRAADSRTRARAPRSETDTAWGCSDAGAGSGWRVTRKSATTQLRGQDCDRASLSEGGGEEERERERAG
eukprot:3938164-Rhodomonas_salina.1